MKTARLRVVLQEVMPAVVRVIDVPATIRLDDLHDVLQVAVGWTDSHPHQFRTDTASYGISDEEWDDDEAYERGVRLADLPARFVYAYDFGDGWEHDIEVIGNGGEVPGCVDGEGACPPEDCGGPSGYDTMLAALADPRHDQYESMQEWVGERLPHPGRDVAPVAGTGSRRVEQVSLVRRSIGPLAVAGSDAACRSCVTCGETRRLLIFG